MYIFSVKEVTIYVDRGISIVEKIFKGKIDHQNIKNINLLNF